MVPQIEDKKSEEETLFSVLEPLDKINIKSATLSNDFSTKESTFSDTKRLSLVSSASDNIVAEDEKENIFHNPLLIGGNVTVEPTAATTDDVQMCPEYHSCAPKSSCDDSVDTSDQQGVSDLFEPSLEEMFIDQSPYEKSGSHDPLLVGLPNSGNFCYQNVTLQILLGLRPFILEAVEVAARIGVKIASHTCPSLYTMARLVVLREFASSSYVAAHVTELRSRLALIDPIFTGDQMQDANEFLLRLLDTIREELDGVDSTISSYNPVRRNFEFQTCDQYVCTRCGHVVKKSQNNISIFVNIPPARDFATPSLQEALCYSVCPGVRELRCNKCQNGESRVDTCITILPRILIVQLNRYTYEHQQLRKLHTSVRIPLYLSLDEHISPSDTTQPLGWNSLSFPENCRLLFFEEDEDYREVKSDSVASYTSSPSAAAISQPLLALPAPRDWPELHQSSEMEEVERSAVCDKTDSGIESQISAPNSYRLVGVVNHHGGAADYGHYVCDVYSIARKCWLRYNDRKVMTVEEAEVLGDDHQRNGYIFFYMHTDIFRQIV